MRYDFRIDGDLPPKKDGANSMWSKPSEFTRLVKLRRAAKAAFDSNPPLTKNISLEVVISIGLINTRSTGDLDNFVTGICDGLQAADSRCKSDQWTLPDYQDIAPTNPIAIRDDCEVISVTARKIIGESIGYTVILEGDIE